MATIVTLHPISFTENEYETAEYLDLTLNTSDRRNTDYLFAIINEIGMKLVNVVKSLPLFNNTLGEVVVHSENTWSGSGGQTKYVESRSYSMILNTMKEYKLVIGLADTVSGNNNGGYAIAGIIASSSAAVGIDYTSDNCVVENIYAGYIKYALNTAYCNNFKMTTYASNSTNGFWFPNGEACNTKILMTKVVNIINGEIKYFPALFNYVNNRQSSASTSDYTQITTEAKIYNGSNFSCFLESGFNKHHAASNSYMLRPLMINDWAYPDIYTIDGGLAPIYNSGAAKIRIDGSDYIFLSNSFLLKIT